MSRLPSAFALASALACTHAADPRFGRPDATVADDAPSTCGFFCDDASFVDDYTPPPWPPDAIAPPDTPCDDAGLCALPPSVCVSAQALEYFDNPVCVDGGCLFQIAFHYCDVCVDGGCFQNHTAPVPP